MSLAVCKVETDSAWIAASLDPFSPEYTFIVHFFIRQQRFGNYWYTAHLRQRLRRTCSFCYWCTVWKSPYRNEEIKTQKIYVLVCSSLITDKNLEVYLNTQWKLYEEWCHSPHYHTARKRRSNHWNVFIGRIRPLNRFMPCFSWPRRSIIWSPNCAKDQNTTFHILLRNNRESLKWLSLEKA